MDTLLGIAGEGWVLMACDTLVARSITVLKTDQDKLVPIGKSAVLGYAGDPGDCSQFVDYICRNVDLYGILKDFPLSTHGIAHFIRGEIAEALRSRGAKQVNMLLGGMDHEGPVLYFLDYLGSLQKMNVAAHGYAAYFCYSLMDKYYRPEMTKQEGIELMRKCLDELRSRFLIETPGFVVRCIDANGVTFVDELTKPGLNVA